MHEGNTGVLDAPRDVGNLETRRSCDVRIRMNSAQGARENKTAPLSNESSSLCLQSSHARIAARRLGGNASRHASSAPLFATKPGRGSAPTCTPSIPAKSFGSAARILIVRSRKIAERSISSIARAITCGTCNICACKRSYRASPCSISPPARHSASNSAWRKLIAKPSPVIASTEPEASPTSATRPCETCCSRETCRSRET